MPTEKVLREDWENSLWRANDYERKRMKEQKYRHESPNASKSNNVIVGKRKK